MQACLETPVETLTRMGEVANRRMRERHNVDMEAAKLAELFQCAVDGGGTLIAPP
jgi:colanic acid/amylovoran biosynthesis glycosyltransferase